MLRGGDLLPYYLLPLLMSLLQHEQNPRLGQAVIFDATDARANYYSYCCYYCHFCS
jgi:hypothetical protein